MDVCTTLSVMGLSIYYGHLFSVDLSHNCIKLKILSLGALTFAIAL